MALPASRGNHGEVYAALRSPLAAAAPDLHLFPLLQAVASLGQQPPPRPRSAHLRAVVLLVHDLPATTQFQFSAAKGYRLGAFGEFLECQGQQQVDSLGYSALPVSLVKDGFVQLKRIPGSQVPTPTSALIRQCQNPTYSANGTNALAGHRPAAARVRQAGADAVLRRHRGRPGRGGRQVLTRCDLSPPCCARPDD